ncbi:hypothetical protein XNC1_1573 [Xenorhabdus nematophila ATCC 19061]|uniref:Uncharacterized protein n=1 Tax=Xenorhabdus nematophila (strain ATCC 19061 / DSM 3370 / CCUG 14189 / LMG 1036 / NCIMB 9965 / AN6) TaxID=406817 RepID=D3VBJ7_XENNA|nr:hypothetical protein XNC1_1573 [Xenorhabdus nematophila ATCC 19061]
MCDYNFTISRSVNVILAKKVYRLAINAFATDYYYLSRRPNITVVHPLAKNRKSHFITELACITFIEFTAYCGQTLTSY